MSPEESAPAERPHATFAAATLTIVLGIVAYANTFDGEFVWDDASSVLLHQHVKDPSKIPQLFTEDQHAFAGGQGNFYRPLLATTFAVDYALSTLGGNRPDPTTIPQNLSPLLFHLTSTAWHIAAALALLALMTRLRAPLPLRLIIPALYIIHPLHTEAVTYISGRADSMSATFIFAGLTAATLNETQKRRIIGLALTALCFTAGLLSKESSLIFPALLALTIAATPTHPSQTKLTRWLPLTASAVILAVYAALRSTVLNFGSDTTPIDSTLAQRITDVLQALALYIKLIILPTNLHMERTLAGVPTYTTALGALALLTIIALTIVAYRAKNNRAALGLATFIITWLPISGIFPLNAPMAEHWLYVPLAGLLWGIAELLHPIIAPRLTHAPNIRLTPAILAAIPLITWAATLLHLTIQRNNDWHDNETLYTATLRQNPDSYRVHFNLAVTYDDLLNNPIAAQRHYQAVVNHYANLKQQNPELQTQFWTEELESHLAIADYYANQHRFNEAFPHYRTVASAQPNDQTIPLVALATYGLGRCFHAAGQNQQANQLFAQALQVLPQLRPQIQKLLPPQYPL